MHRTWIPLLVSLALSTAATAQQPWFEQVAAARGIDFRHQDGRSGEKYYVESAASGGGFLDYDGDGDLDLYLVNGAATPGSKITGTPTNALYENRGDRFVDVTAQAGVGDTGFGMGLCAGDIDADGRLDFLVTNYGADRLYRNLGRDASGVVRFEEIGAKAGVADARWSASCAFGDLDGDGDLDLYVTHYVRFEFASNPFCGDRARNLRAYCRPDAFDGVPDSLFINQGDGTFRDEGKARGLSQSKDEKGFGVILSDLDDDGDLDVYVANDGTLNRLYVNDGKGRFADDALLAGVGLNSRGVAESGMGVTLGDVDGDGREDLLVTNYSMESNTLYRNRGGLIFEDGTRAAGLAEVSYRYVGWGTAFFDADNDGDLDLGLVNGHAVDNIEIFEASLQYRQPNQLMENLGDGRFRDASRVAGPAFAVERVSRALAQGDFDDDGRIDLLVTNTNDPIDLLHNGRQTGRHWLGLVLRGPAANPFAIGARATLTLAGKRQVREVRSGGSFLAQSDLRPHFGLGSHQGPVTVEIRWPDGRVQRETTDTLDRYWTIEYRPAAR
jgi:hypothetical protein